MIHTDKKLQAGLEEEAQWPEYWRKRQIADNLF